MYLNSGGILHSGQNSNGLMVPQPEPFSRSLSDAATNGNGIKQEPVYLTEEFNGFRMKRFNSLPDVADYLDPNVSQPNYRTGILNNFPNPQMETIMAAFSQGQVNNKMIGKPYFEQGLSDNQLDGQLQLSVPMTTNLSTSSNYQHSPIPPSPQFNHSVSLQADNSQFGWTDSTRSPFLNDNGFDPFGFEDRKRPIENEYNYSNSQLDYSNNNPLEVLSQPSPHFNQQSLYMPSNPFKRMRPDSVLDNNYNMPPPMYNTMGDMGLVFPLQPAPAPDSATSQAAQDAIAAASQYPPPSEDNGDPDLIPRRQHLRYQGDLYTPQWVRGAGHKKEGYCDLCSPGKWLQLKNSAYWYHKQFFHGISSVSGKFFAGPAQTRQRDADIVEGCCHQCQQWVQMSSAKRRNSVLWFRHAHKCHVYHKPKNVYGKKV